MGHQLLHFQVKSGGTKTKEGLEGITEIILVHHHYLLRGGGEEAEVETGADCLQKGLGEDNQVTVHRIEGLLLLQLSRKAAKTRAKKERRDILNQVHLTTMSTIITIASLITTSPTSLYFYCFLCVLIFPVVL